MEKVTLNFKGLKAFEKKILEIMEDNSLLMDDIYYLRYFENGMLTESDFRVNFVTKNGTNIELKLSEYTDYERPLSNKYVYKLFIDPIQGEQREIYFLSTIDLVEGLLSVITTF